MRASYEHLIGERIEDLTEGGGNEKKQLLSYQATDGDGETYYFKHYTMEHPELITALEENAGVVGDWELRRATDDLVSLGWRRDQMTFIHVGGMVEGGKV